MIAGLRVIWRGLRAVWLSGYVYIWANLAFIALCMPVVTAPGAFSALMRVAHAAQKTPHEADLDLFWETFKANWRPAFIWGIAHAIFAFVNFTNLFTYVDEPGIIASVLRGIWLAAGIAWIGVLFYTWAIYYEMQSPTLWGATRNALVMVLQNPFFTMAILASMIILAIISTVLMAMWLLLTWSIFAAVFNAAVQDRLKVVYR
ncbi:MAG: hypothetical protein Kow00117_08980 [Phototrophicales bacterium]|nr:MAG: hypothetical protein CUN56_01570 [Phototrophicales bacterium]RMG76379.1 MAG: DUF624 domain-containing protein [Chloroflexota bacterium]